MKRWITNGLVLYSLALAPVVNLPAAAATDKHYTKDSRFRRIKSFFEKRSCPMHSYAADMVAAADKHKLDWRLLPSLALVESSGGKAYKNNNVFGWDSCRQKFPTIRAGIHIVAERLANSPYYRGKNLDDKLHAYNQNPKYAATVKRVMYQLATETW